MTTEHVSDLSHQHKAPPRCDLHASTECAHYLGVLSAWQPAGYRASEWCDVCGWKLKSSMFPEQSNTTERARILQSFGIPDDVGMIEAMAETENRIESDWLEMAEELEADDDLDGAGLARSLSTVHRANVRDLESLL